MLEAVLIRLFYIKSKIIQNPFKRNKFFNRFFASFNNSLEKMTETKLEPHYKLRFYEIEKVIKKYQIRHVVEMGTGRTTFVFNIIPNVTCISIEQDAEWLAIIEDLLQSSGINSKIHLSSVSRYKNGAKFEELPDVVPDLLYIDAPYLKREGNEKAFNTHTGKAAYYDFETFFERDVFPRVIMIEGRTDTADVILGSEHANKYEFTGEFIFCIQRKKYFSSLKLSRHSIFTLKE